MLLDSASIFSPMLAIFICALVLSVCDSAAYENTFCAERKCPTTGYFRCKETGRCTSQSNVCNRYDNCGDGSDEENCGPVYLDCRDGHGFHCDNGTRCLHYSSVCNGVQSCTDGSDERDCLSRQCPYDGDFKCNDTGVCLRGYDRCDGYSECQHRYGSASDYDEQNCDLVPCPYDGDHRCDSNHCIRSTNLCDGSNNCADGSDEANCDDYTCLYNGDIKCNGRCYRSDVFCHGYQKCYASEITNCSFQSCPYDVDYRCPLDGACIRSYEVCDGRCTCRGCADEDNCTSLNCGLLSSYYVWCPRYNYCDDIYYAYCYSRCGYNNNSFYRCYDCGNATIVNIVVECNGVEDCSDGNDELNCFERQCFAVDDFRCTTTGACIRSYKVCDGTVDCSDRSDEESCLSRNCTILGDVKCQDNGTCIHSDMVCNGISDCMDGSDEANCGERMCPFPGDMRCSSSQACIRSYQWCDQVYNCDDQSDEEYCYDIPCPYADDFRCAFNGGCVRATVVCDGYNENCLDGSDEGLNYCPEDVTMGVVWERSLTKTTHKYQCSSIHPSFKLADMAMRECMRNRSWSPVDMSQCVMDVDSPVVMILVITLDTENTTMVQAKMDQIMEEISNAVIDATSVQFVMLDTFEKVSLKITYEFSTFTSDQLVELINYEQRLTTVGRFNVSTGPQLTVFESTGACKCPNSVESSTIRFSVNNTEGLTIFSVCNGKSCQCSTSTTCQCKPPFVGNGVVCGRDSDGDGYADMKLNCDDPECAQDICSNIYNPQQTNTSCGISTVESGSSSSDDSLSTGAAVGITFVVTLLLSVAFTLLVVYIVYKIRTRKEQAASEDEVPTSAKPIVTAKDSDVYEFPENVQSPRYQGDPLATIQPNPSYDMHYFGTKNDKPVYANVK